MLCTGSSYLRMAGCQAGSQFLFICSTPTCDCCVWSFETPLRGLQADQCLLVVQRPQELQYANQPDSRQ